jgi:hypothetical protein
MTSNIDIYQTANELIKQHGEDAPIHAAMRADELLDAGVFCVPDWGEQCPYFLRLHSFIAPWFDRPGNRGFSAGRELWLVGIIKPNYLDGRCSMAS